MLTLSYFVCPLLIEFELLYSSGVVIGNLSALQAFICFLSNLEKETYT
ncbi:hypothetical protein MtrunA17_Chr7g0253601 [Medicago truncatula]|uniref:Transmembrane protein n=1 Tax=Medicago truncatula TaxID=3880 RepID=A0A396H2B2_MEDTR|nr:hypothetical protein MtrunA17_Chr7g0253601 [Medicago truncatula]